MNRITGQNLRGENEPDNGTESAGENEPDEGGESEDKKAVMETEAGL